MEFGKDRGSLADRIRACQLQPKRFSRALLCIPFEKSCTALSLASVMLPIAATAGLALQIHKDEFEADASREYESPDFLAGTLSQLSRRADGDDHSLLHVGIRHRLERRSRPTSEIHLRSQLRTRDVDPVCVFLGLFHFLDPLKIPDRKYHFIHG